MHLGGGGHYGKGLGLYYALEGIPADHAGPWDPVSNEFRTMRRLFDLRSIRRGARRLQRGIWPYRRCTCSHVDQDAGVMANESVIKSQTGISAGIVFHATESLHLDVDYLNAKFAWYGERSRRSTTSTPAPR